MPNQELEKYITQARAFGKTDEQIRQELLKAGWEERQINEALLSRMTTNIATGKSHKIYIFALTLLVLGIFFYLSSSLFYNPLEPINKQSLPLLLPFLSIISVLGNFIITGAFLVVSKRNKINLLGGITWLIYAVYEAYMTLIWGPSAVAPIRVDLIFIEPFLIGISVVDIIIVTIILIKEHVRKLWILLGLAIIITPFIINSHYHDTLIKTEAENNPIVCKTPLNKPLPDWFPKDFPIYPGSKRYLSLEEEDSYGITSNSSVNNSSKGGVFTFCSDDRNQRVKDYYLNYQGPWKVKYTPGNFELTNPNFPSAMAYIDFYGGHYQKDKTEIRIQYVNRTK